MVPVRPIIPGPLVLRDLLASAVVSTSHLWRVGDKFHSGDREPEAELVLFREYAQPFNFTRNEDSVAFTTPTYGDVQASLMDGYADVVLHLSTGTRSSLSKVLLYTEDCPQVRC